MPKMPNLQVLRMQAYHTGKNAAPRVDVQDLAKLSDSSPHLETLILPQFIIKGFTNDYREGILVETFSKWSNLIELSLTHNDITNGLLKALLQNTPNVEYLNVAGCTRIGGTGLVQFAKSRMNNVTNERGLKRLNISGCTKVRMTISSPCIIIVLVINFFRCAGVAHVEFLVNQKKRSPRTSFNNYRST
jgi:hypothetical protein